MHPLHIPDCSDLDIPDDLDYVYICENNTIYGTKYKKLPNTKGKTLVADVSSCFLSEPVDVTKYGVIYGGVQKNIGPAGVVIVIAREDLITDDVLPGTPTMLKWKTQADKDSLYNTPPCYGIYICGKVFKWLKKMGGLEEMQRRNIEKAKILYDFLDESKLFTDECTVRNRRQGYGCEIRKRGNRGWLRKPERTSYRWRYACIHLQRNAKRGRRKAC